jgi:hypothetical protein
VRDQLIDNNSYGLINPSGGTPLVLSEETVISREVPCLSSVKKIVLTPGHFLPNTDFSVQTAGPLVKVTILNPDRFRAAGRFLVISVE